MISTTTRIEINLIDYSKRRNTVQKECYLLLDAECIQYKVVADYEKLCDDEITWEPVRANFRWTRKRSSICNIEMYLDNSENLWSVDMEFDGINATMSWCFDDPKQCLNVYTQLSDYMLGNS